MRAGLIGDRLAPYKRNRPRPQLRRHLPDRSRAHHRRLSADKNQKQLLAAVEAFLPERMQVFTVYGVKIDSEIDIGEHLRLIGIPIKIVELILPFDICSPETR